MVKHNNTQPETDEAKFAKQIAIDARRKLRAERNEGKGIWSGLGVSGVIGWSVAIPAFFGAMLGLWIDGHYHNRHSWTLALLAAGLAIGCWNAWHWVEIQNKTIAEELAGHDE